jgi:hypothetical protein
VVASPLNLSSSKIKVAFVSGEPEQLNKRGLYLRVAVKTVISVTEVGENKFGKSLSYLEKAIIICSTTQCNRSLKQMARAVKLVAGN